LITYALHICDVGLRRSEFDAIVVRNERHEADD